MAVNRTQEMRELSFDERNHLIAFGVADGHVHDLRPVLAEKLKNRMAFARVSVPTLEDPTI